MRWNLKEASTRSTENRMGCPQTDSVERERYAGVPSTGSPDDRERNGAGDFDGTHTGQGQPKPREQTGQTKLWRAGHKRNDSRSGSAIAEGT
ncbi:hypothetical protein NXG27_03915 [Megasphaera paucivorans]|uniref:Uncharacterized protein n=1 Tax=Megasphaera paucivorans TaxID=349095 RepID=A0A1G9QYL9_9FIRM|nr:hypothetical protein [Megasphaera paucivorans]SDM15961.1 hypothetical protein SAMN05660299_00327 [Megasphaera paucivorans]